MMKRWILSAVMAAVFLSQPVHSQIGKPFPSERKVVKDPVTGIELTFLTSTPAGDSKIYPTHNQWTADGEWLIFRSNRVKGEALAVHEKTGEMVQVTEGGYTGMLNIGRKAMKLWFMRNPAIANGSMEIVEVDLGKLFNDVRSGTVKKSLAYQRVCVTTPPALGAGGDMAVDANEDWAYFREGNDEAGRHLAKDVKLEADYGPRKMGAGPGGIAAANLVTGEIRHVVSVSFQVGHIQTNPWVPGEIVFCWETGGKSPQRTWIVKADGTGLRPLYPEASFEWVTHEAVITKDEVAIAILGHRPIKKSVEGDSVPDKTANPGQEKEWGQNGTREKPTGLAIVNIRSRETIIAGQTTSGSGLWHVTGSSDGRWAAADDFSRSLYLIDRHTREMMMLSTGHKTTAADHPHPTFSPDGTRIQIQSAMLSQDGRSMNICIVPVPAEWLQRK